MEAVRSGCLAYLNLNSLADIEPAQWAACVIVNVSKRSQPRKGWHHYVRALAYDRLSAYGGIIAFNRPIDEETAVEIVYTRPSGSLLSRS